MTTAATKRTTAEAKAKPVLNVQVGGVRIPIWKNEGDDGSYFKAGQPELSYKGKDGWHTAKSYGPRDLVNLIKAAALAHSEILQRSRAEKTGSAEEDAADDAGE